MKHTINHKCDIHKIGYIGITHKDEALLNKEYETHILVKFEISSGVTIVVNRIITMIDNEKIGDEFYFSKRDSWNDVPEFKNWKTKDEFDNEYCDWLSYIHYGLENINTNIESEYFLGSIFITKSSYENDRFLNNMNEEYKSQYKTTYDIIEEVDARMIEMEQDGLI
tara:strand:- start:330 stop:830 length:501 start_codon:yes stop_codon:yes gene_type:complete